MQQDLLTRHITIENDFRLGRPPLELCAPTTAEFKRWISALRTACSPFEALGEPPAATGSQKELAQELIFVAFAAAHHSGASQVALGSITPRQRHKNV